MKIRGSFFWTWLGAMLLVALGAPAAWAGLIGVPGCSAIAVRGNASLEVCGGEWQVRNLTTNATTPVTGLPAGWNPTVDSPDASHPFVGGQTPAGNQAFILDVGTGTHTVTNETIGGGFYLAALSPDGTGAGQSGGPAITHDGVVTHVTLNPGWASDISNQNYVSGSSDSQAFHTGISGVTSTRCIRWIGLIP